MVSGLSVEYGTQLGGEKGGNLTVWATESKPCVAAVARTSLDIVFPLCGMNLWDPRSTEKPQMCRGFEKLLTLCSSVRRWPSLFLKSLGCGNVQILSLLEYQSELEWKNNVQDLIAILLGRNQGSYTLSTPYRGCFTLPARLSVVMMRMVSIRTRGRPLSHRGWEDVPPRLEDPGQSGEALRAYLVPVLLKVARCTLLRVRCFGRGVSVDSSIVRQRLFLTRWILPSPTKMRSNTCKLSGVSSFSRSVRRTEYSV